MNKFKFFFSFILLVLVCISIAVPSIFAKGRKPDQSDLVEKPVKLDLHPFYYHEGFENGDPFLKWASNGTYKINSKGISSEKASSGKKSFKIDITFGTASYVYFMIPVEIPNIGELNFSGDISVTQASGVSAALGTNISLFPCPRSGVNILQKQLKQYNEWKTQKSDLIKSGLAKAKNHTSSYVAGATYKDVGIWTNSIGLFFFGTQGSSITVFVDNIEINGNVPEVEEYKRTVQNAWQTYKYRSEKSLKEILNVLGDYKKDEVDSILKSMTKRGYLSSKELQKLIDFEEDSKFRVSIHKDGVKTNIVIYPWDPMHRRKILPKTFPIPSVASNTIRVEASPSEYEPFSFIVRAHRDFTNISISYGDLLNQNDNRLTAKNVDLSIVKCWFQGSEHSILQDRGQGRFLIPELLLKDDSMIKVNSALKKNYLKVWSNNDYRYIDISTNKMEFSKNDVIKDADELQPFTLKKNRNKQIWGTVYIPELTAPGEYKGKIIITGDNAVNIDLDLTVKVLDIKLSNPKVEYSMYYTGRLSDKKIKPFTSEYKTASQYEIEMKDLKLHGVTSCTIYQRLDKKLHDALKIRSKVGIAGNNLYVLGTWTGSPTDVLGLEKLSQKVLLWKKYAKQYNYKNVYIYGMDEAGIDIIRSQKKAWERVHELGAGILVASPHDAIDAAPKLLDIGVLSGKLNSKTSERWHRKGSKVFSYGNPQIGVENPSIYRQNFGFDLWLAGYDGAMNFAYQYDMGNIWNDFDHNDYRDHVFAYPITNGVINTIQWEGFREAVDDVKYLTTLLLKNKYDEISLRKKLLQLRKTGVSPSQMRSFIIAELLDS